MRGGVSKSKRSTSEFSAIAVIQMKIDREYVRETLVRLVSTNSVNPTLAPGAPGERVIAGIIAASLTSRKLKTDIFEPEPGRISVVGKLAGSGLRPNIPSHRR